MSRTFHHKNKNRRLVANSLYKKTLHLWEEDFKSKKGKQRDINRQLRTKLKKQTRKEMIDNDIY